MQRVSGVGLAQAARQRDEERVQDATRHHGDAVVGQGRKVSSRCSAVFMQ